MIKKKKKNAPIRVRRRGSDAGESDAAFFRSRCAGTAFRSIKKKRIKLDETVRFEKKTHKKKIPIQFFLRNSTFESFFFKLWNSCNRPYYFY